ncbi:hypothetical protein KDL01_42760, partial [Actinospica durhamensis]|nr:hypothetical protein [Actinospica durhamensis]
MQEEQGAVPRSAPLGVAGWWIPAALLVYAAAGLAWVVGAEAMVPAGSGLRMALEAAFVLAPAGCGVWALGRWRARGREIAVLAQGAAQADERQRLAATVVDNAAEGMVVTDAGSRILSV